MKTNIFFGNNVKFLRTRKKQTQENLAKHLLMTRSKLNCIETGQTKSPSIEDMLKFSAHFKMSLDTLVKIDLSKLGELKLRELESGNDIYIKGGNLRVLAITVDRQNNENVEYVPVKAKAGYRSGHTDPQYIASLPKYSLPNLPKQGTFRIFPTEGDSMLPIPENSDVIGEYVENWSSIKPKTLCILILKSNQDFVFKMVTLREDRNFLLESMNQVYKPYTVEANDVLEIWRFRAFTSSALPPLISGFDDMLRELKSIKSELKAIKLPTGT